MRRAWAAGLFLCCACASRPVPAVQTRNDQAVVVATDTLTTIERVRIVEAALRFRAMIFVGDSTTKLDGCSLEPVFGSSYLEMFERHMRPLVAVPTQRCTERHRSPGFGRKLALNRIIGSSGRAVIQLSYGDGSYFHEEEYQVQKASRRPDGIWAGTEMRVYDAMIVD